MTASRSFAPRTYPSGMAAGVGEAAYLAKLEDAIVRTRARLGEWTAKASAYGLARHDAPSRMDRIERDLVLARQEAAIDSEAARRSERRKKIPEVVSPGTRSSRTTHRTSGPVTTSGLTICSFDPSSRSSSWRSAHYASSGDRTACAGGVEEVAAKRQTRRRDPGNWRTSPRVSPRSLARTNESARTG